MPPKNGNKPATQSDVRRLDGGIRRLDSRIDGVDKKFDRLAIDLIKTREEMATKADIAGINKQLDRIIGTLDSFVGEAADNKRSFLIQGKMLGDHGRQLKSHETRLSALEAKA